MKESFDYELPSWASTKYSELPFQLGKIEVLNGDGTVRVHELSSGDVIYVPDTDRHNNVKVGEKFKNYPAIVSEICYTSKRWWQFWKRKKQLGYFVRWL